MPVVLRIHEVAGFPEGNIGDRASDLANEAGLDRGLLAAELRIPHLWGLEPLERIAEFLALERRPPHPWDPTADPPDRGCQAEYLDVAADGAVPRPSALLSADIFVPVASDSPGDGAASSPPASGELEGDVASLDSLEREMGELLEFLEQVGGVPETLADAARKVEADPGNAEYSLETYSALALQEACRWARSAELPLVLDFEPASKPVDQAFSSWTAHLYGFDVFRSAETGDEGHSLVVELLSGYRYRVPAAYLSQWFDKDPVLDPRIEAVELTADEGLELRISGSGGWDVAFSPLHLLKRVEPSYDEFGDLPEAERRRLAPYLAEAHGFRECPPPAGTLRPEKSASCRNSLVDRR